MKKFFLLWLPVIVAGVVVIIFAFEMTSIDSISDRDELNVNTELEGLAELARDGTAKEDEQAREEHGANRAHVSRFPVEQSSEARWLKDAFDYSLPLVEAFEIIAAEGAWEYDHMINNLLNWGFLCDAGEYRLSIFLNKSSDARKIQDDVARLCSGYGAKLPEMDRYQALQDELRTAGFKQVGALENSLDELGPDGATITAVAAISSALDRSDYGGVSRALWFLGNFNFAGVSDDLAVYSNSPNVETMYAVSSSIFCSSIGGCDGNHPITINLCMMLYWLPCNRWPDHIDDAIGQILTGAEMETYNEMYSALVHLLNRYRAGNL